MTTFWLKQCPRCRVGDLYVDNDMYGKSLACLQCGRRRDIIDGVVQEPKAAEKLLELPKSETNPDGITEIRNEPGRDHC